MTTATLNPPASPEYDNSDFGLNAEEQQFANAGPGLPQKQEPDFGQKLRQQTIAVRLHRSKWGISRKLNRAQVEQAAQQFNAETDRLMANKKVIDSKGEKYRACLATLGAAVAFWRDVTVPYPEDGVRLMRKDRVAQFEHQLNALKAQLAENVSDLKLSYNQIIEASRNELGVLFNPDDYPSSESLEELFGLSWEYPSLKADEYLKQINPALYESESKRIQARFDEAVKLAEEAFIEEFAKVVGVLAERLQFGEDGKPKVFRESVVTNMLDYFNRFKELNVGSSAELEQLVAEAQQLVQGGDGEKLAKDLRKDVNMRRGLQQSMAQLSAKIDAQLVSRPLRSVSLDE